MTWALIALGIISIIGVVFVLACCKLSGDLAQQEEDRYGVDKARRS